MPVLFANLLRYGILEHSEFTELIRYSSLTSVNHAASDYDVMIWVHVALKFKP